MLLTLFTQIESITGGNVVRTLEVLNSVAAGAPVEEQNVVNARMIANALNATALLLTDRNMQLSTEDMIEVCCYNLHSKMVLYNIV